MRSRPAEDRYRERIDTSAGPDACWPWTASRSVDGYGHLRVGERVLIAHRFGYELLVGAIPAGLVVMHTCDSPPCQNPAHWRLGTQGDNVRDMAAKGRCVSRIGDLHRKLTAEQVAEAVGRYTGAWGQLTALAREYGVTKQAMQRHLVAAGLKGPLSPGS